MSVADISPADTDDKVGILTAGIDDPRDAAELGEAGQRDVRQRPTQPTGVVKQLVGDHLRRRAALSEELLGRVVGRVRDPAVGVRDDDEGQVGLGVPRLARPLVKRCPQSLDVSDVVTGRQPQMLDDGLTVL